MYDSDVSQALMSASYDDVCQFGEKLVQPQDQDLDPASLVLPNGVTCIAENCNGYKPPRLLRPGCLSARVVMITEESTGEANICVSIPSRVGRLARKAFDTADIDTIAICAEIWDIHDFSDLTKQLTASE
jgi:hypothetical protein